MHLDLEPGALKGNFEPVPKRLSDGLALAGDFEQSTSERFQQGFASRPCPRQYDKPATRPEHSPDLGQCPRINNVLGGEGGNHGIEATVKWEGLGPAAHQAWGPAMPVQPAGGLPAHLAAFIQTDGWYSLFVQGQLEVTGAMADLQDARSLNIWKNGANPFIPTPEGDDGCNQVICPGQAVIKVVKEEAQETKSVHVRWINT